MITWVNINGFSLGICTDIVEIWFDFANEQICLNYWQSYLPTTRPYFCFQMITWVINQFSPNLECALILWTVCFGIANGQISSILDWVTFVSVCLTIVVGYYHFTFLFSVDLAFGDGGWGGSGGGEAGSGYKCLVYNAFYLKILKKFKKRQHWYLCIFRWMVAWTVDMSKSMTFQQCYRYAPGATSDELNGKRHFKRYWTQRSTMEET